jgi:enoyl-CoA hydratase/carnithine racemase
MTQPSTISVERPTSTICKIEFANPPVNLIVPETVFRLHEVVKELSEDEKVQVVIFTSGIHDIEKGLGHYLGIANKYL